MRGNRARGARHRQPRPEARGETLAYWYGGRRGRRHEVLVRLDALTIHSKPGWSPDRLLRLGAKAQGGGGLQVVSRVPDLGVTIISAEDSRQPTAALARLQKRLAGDARVRRVDIALWDVQTKRYVYAAGQMVVRFSRPVRLKEARGLLGVGKGMQLKDVPFADDAFIFDPGLPTARLFEAAQKLLRLRGIVEAYPAVAEPLDGRMPMPPYDFPLDPALASNWRTARAWPNTTSRHHASTNDWHLRRTTLNGVTVDAGANVVAAWSVTRGQGVKIAVIDDIGIEIDHPELRGDKVHATEDSTAWPASTSTDPTPQQTGFAHGTACAAVALGRGIHASGVAPRASLIAIRCAGGLRSPGEAYAFYAAAAHGADVILCPWGPPDSPRGLQHDIAPLTDLAIRFVTRYGRDAKGCVVVFAAGNGGADDIALDGYASHPEVLAIGACGSAGGLAPYSDIGERLFALFPSGDTSRDGLHCLWTAGSRDDSDVGCAQSARNRYSWLTGTTSLASSGAAGVAALVIAARPDLTRSQVVQIMRKSCEKIEPVTACYDASSGHSLTHGYGRLDAYAAVLLT